MKKIYTILTLVLVFILSSCNSIKEYKGVKINKITYISIDYNGGYTVKHELDFNENKYSNVGYLPPEDNNPILENKSTFTDDTVTTLAVTKLVLNISFPVLSYTSTIDL